MKVYDSIVIGAGQSGLASAYHLKKQKLDYLVLEASKQTTGSWPNYYDSLTLFSPAKYSSLPEYHFPGDPDRYPTKGKQSLI
jgi:putative flavoprotein involved in K+ transport